MKIELESKDIEAISQRVLELLKPYLAQGKSLKEPQRSPKIHVSTWLPNRLLSTFRFQSQQSGPGPTREGFHLQNWEGKCFLTVRI